MLRIGQNLGYKGAVTSPLIAPPRILRSYSSRSSRSYPRCVMSSAVTSGLEQALRVYDVEKLSPQELKAVLARPRIDFSSILATVRGASRRYSPTHIVHSSSKR